MKFRAITANKYIGTDGYYLHRGKDGCFSICIGPQVTKWGTGFKTVRSAENFLSHRNYIKATTEILPIAPDDIEFIIETYGLEYDKLADEPYVYYRDEFSLIVPIDFDETGEIQLELEDRNGVPIREWYQDTGTLLKRLDQLVDNDIFANVILRGTNCRAIIAANNRRSARDITKNLVRVKSSNVWAYGIEIKDNDQKVGDVYVQFKGKNGGPGSVYRYYDVPIQLWRRFIAAPSKGHFLYKYLRNNFYYSKLTEDKRGKLPNAIN